MILQLILTKTASGYLVARQVGHGEAARGPFVAGMKKGNYLIRTFPDKETARLYAQRMEGTGLDQITWQITDLL